MDTGPVESAKHTAESGHQEDQRFGDQDNGPIDRQSGRGSLHSTGLTLVPRVSHQVCGGFYQ